MELIYSSSQQFSASTVLEDGTEGADNFIYLANYSASIEQNLLFFNYSSIFLQGTSNLPVNYSFGLQFLNFKNYSLPLQTYSDVQEIYTVSDQYLKTIKYNIPLQIYGGSQKKYAVSDQYWELTQYRIPLQIYSGSHEQYAVSDQYDAASIVFVGELQRNLFLNNKEEYILWLLRGKNSQNIYKNWKTRQDPSKKTPSHPGVLADTIEITGRLVKNEIKAPNVSEIYIYNNATQELERFASNTTGSEGIPTGVQQVGLQKIDMIDYERVIDEWLMRGRDDTTGKYKNWRKQKNPGKLSNTKQVIEQTIENSGRIYLKR